MDPEKPTNPRYNLRPRKPKQQSPEDTRSIRDRFLRKRFTPKLFTRKGKGKGKGKGKKSNRAVDEEEMSSTTFEGGRYQRPKERVVTWQHDGSRIDDPAYLPAQWDPNEYDLNEK